MINLKDEEFKAFEKEALTFLKTLNFTATGYYPYERAQRRSFLLH
jgi:hypothetical protein